MFKNLFFAVLALGGILLLSGCVNNDSYAQNVSPDDRLTDECFLLKQRMVNNESVYNVPDQQGLNPTIEAQLLKSYETNNCDAVIHAANAQKVVN